MSELALATLGQMVHTLRGAADDIGIQVESLDRLERQLPGAPLSSTVALELLLGSFDTLAAHCSEPASFGIWLADRLENEHRPQLVTLVARTRPRLGDALRRYVSLFRELDPDTRTSFSIIDGVATVSLARRAGAMPVPDVVADFALIGLRDIVRSVDIEPAVPARFHFARARPSALSSWVERFGEDLRFGALGSGVSIPTHCLAAPMRTADPYLASLLLPGSSSDNHRGALETKVQRALDRALSNGSQLLTSVAERLGMSGRTLQRRLRDADIDFSALVESARRRRALSLIRCRSLSVKDVAGQSGYEDLRSFRASFVRWTGMTPREFRRRDAP